MIKFISIDTSLRNTGVAIGRTNGTDVSIDKIYLHETQKSTNKQVRASSDTIDRCRSTYNFVDSVIKEEDPAVIFVETPSGSQSASGMKSYGVTCQLIGSINPPPIEVTPDEVKKASIGRKNASKRQIIEWAYNKYSKLSWLTKKQKGVVSLIDKNEHMADAIAIVYAGIKTNQFQQLLTLLMR